MPFAHTWGFGSSEAHMVLLMPRAQKSDPFRMLGMGSSDVGNINARFLVGGPSGFLKPRLPVVFYCWTVHAAIFESNGTFSWQRALKPQAVEAEPWEAVQRPNRAGTTLGGTGRVQLWMSSTTRRPEGQYSIFNGHYHPSLSALEAGIV